MTPPRFQAQEEVERTPITSEEAQLMVRLHAQYQQPNSEITLGSVMELLHLSPQEASELLDKARKGLPPQQFNATPTRVSRMPKRAWMVPVAILIGLMWLSVGLRIFANTRHAISRSISGSGLNPTVASGVQGAPGVDVLLDLGFIREGIYGGASTKELNELTTAEAQTLRNQIATSIVQALRTRGNIYYAIQPSGPDSTRSISVTIRPFGNPGSWTTFPIEIEPEMFPVGSDQNADASLTKQIESDLKLQWPIIVHRNSPSLR